LTLAAVSVVALVYTGPWDNLIIIEGVWSYGRHQVIGLVIGHVPLEEFMFYVLQVFLTGMVTVFFLRRDR
jgi:lycopene cyclase domain-containing protein